MWAMILIDTQLPPTMAKATVVEVGNEHVKHSHIKEASLLLKSQYSEKGFKKADPATHAVSRFELRKPSKRQQRRGGNFHR